MAITNDQIRDLLNRPRGLTEGTISEYVTIRTDQVNKVARSSTLYAVSADSAVSTDNKESAIKFLVCVDCLNVLIDTVPTYYPESVQRTTDQRFREQLTRFQAQADELLGMVSEKGGTAFNIKSTETRQETKSTIPTTETRTLGL